MSCQKEDRNLREAGFDVPFTLQLRQSAALPSADQPEVQLSVEGLQDSRCPTEITCVWEGTISVQVKAQMGPATQTTQLCLGPCSAKAERKTVDSTDLDFSGKRYRLYFEGTTPAKNSTKLSDVDKVMQFRLKHL